jgi:chemotaxis response regulator CheB
MRIAIVNDMVMAVEAMRRLLITARGHELAWVARDGAEAVERCARDTPDLVLMDLIMPEMDGVEATRRIMARNPCAIVVVTASVNRNSSKVFEAMGAGALDAVKTPSWEHPGAEAFLGKIQTINRLIGKDVAKQMRSAPPLPSGHRPGKPMLIAIGASAGGPAALAKILGRLPAGFPASIIAIQHVDAQFADGLASWLGTQSRLPVRLAREGDHPAPGTVLIAGSEDHLVFTAPGRLGYTSEPADRPYRPSIDEFLKSIQQFWRGKVVGVLLTGMGRDGAAGLKMLHHAGHHTIAQDEATSAVYGMPKAAAQLKAATETLPLDRIASRLITLSTPKPSHHGRL